ncbi:hypothetical protein ACFSCX_10345 [Bacillus salitolerans]|uniref:Uncharacterized protein n=1 Tax=Bacillus salitolerans TaxID=1437434 RepID=A0ABW4LR22_9BACI
MREKAAHYPQATPPSIDLLYLSKDDSHGVGMTILFHQSGPSVICYEKSSSETPPANKELALPDILKRLCIGYQNRYSFFTISNVEKKSKV